MGRRSTSLNHVASSESWGTIKLSPIFVVVDSHYCYSIEVQKALERHENGEAQVISIILRPCLWKIAIKGKLSKLQALPKDAKPAISANWHNIDEAFFDVAEGIQKVVQEYDNNIQVAVRSRMKLISTSRPFHPLPT